MSLWNRLANVFRGDRLNREIDAELQAHLDEAVAQGRDRVEAQRAFGSALLAREQSRDSRLLPVVDSLRADWIFGWRQLRKNKVASAASVLSLALAIGACTSAFRLVDALLLRPLPVKGPEQLYAIARQGIDVDGKLRTGDAFAYPAFALMRDAVKDQADLFGVGYASRADLTYSTDLEMEKAQVQNVSGAMFQLMGLNPAAGRLLTASDDVTPGGHPLAVISYDYWNSRLGGDPKVVGRTFRMDSGVYEIIGVTPKGFLGTEPGTAVDVYVPMMMHPGATKDDWTWFRILARVKPGVKIEPLRAKLHSVSRAFEERRARSFTGMTKEAIERFLAVELIMEPAPSGMSDMQREFRVPLMALTVLAALVLLIACANVANLMTAQAAARAREMALRVSIGAGRWRLVQLVLMESLQMALLAAVLGGAFAWWSAPFVVSMINPPNNPARLNLPADWRLLAFGLALALAVTFLFGLAPALRASAVKPVSALKGGEDPHSKRRMMHALIAAQVAFCFVVLFVAGLFVTTFERLARKPLGFSTERLLALDTLSPRRQPIDYWEQALQQLRTTPGVEKAAYSGWALLGGGGWNGFVSINGAPPSPVLSFFLNVSPDWFDVMNMPVIAGRGLTEADRSPGSAVVNEAFVRQFLNGRVQIGTLFAKGQERYQIVGVVRDTPYRSLREGIVPIAFVPIRELNAKGEARLRSGGTFIVRTAAANPTALASALRAAVPQARSEFRVSNIRTQEEIVNAQTVRERLIAMLAFFFAMVALVLAAVGLYGVLDYSVLQRRREIGIRMAIGARAGDITRRVTSDVFAMVCAGATAGLIVGLWSVRYIETMLYGVKGTDASMLALPSIAIVTAAWGCRAVAWFQPR